MTSYVRAPLTFAAHQRATVGDQKISFTGFDHLGWLKCDGRAVSRSTYALLFNVVGTTFGTGDSSTTFNLPNYQGCVPGIPGTPPVPDINGANSTTYVLGDLESGEQRHKLIIDEIPAHTHGSVDVSGDTNGNGLTGLAGAHTHTINDSGHSHSYENQPIVPRLAPSLAIMGSADSGNVQQTTGISTTGISINSVVGHQHSIGNTGGSNWHNNMQPTLFGGNMFVFSGLMYTGLGTYPFSTGTDLA